MLAPWTLLSGVLFNLPDALGPTRAVLRCDPWRRCFYGRCATSWCLTECKHLVFGPIQAVLYWCRHVHPMLYGDGSFNGVLVLIMTSSSTFIHLSVRSHSGNTCRRPFVGGRYVYLLHWTLLSLLDTMNILPLHRFINSSLKCTILHLFVGSWTFGLNVPCIFLHVFAGLWTLGP